MKKKLPHYTAARIMSRTILLSLSIPALCSADIYIAQNVTGSNTGQSCADALSDRFNDAANWGSGATQIGPGAIVHLCGSISGNLTVQGSGTRGAPVTVFFERDAKLSQPAGGPFLTMNNKEFILVDGGANGVIENTAADTRTSMSAAKALWHMNAQTARSRI